MELKIFDVEHGAWVSGDSIPISLIDELYVRGISPPVTVP
jgi:hypothetical protein